LIEGGAGRADGGIHVSFTSFWHHCPGSPGIRVDTLESAARLGVHPCASNEHLVVAYFSGHRCLNHLHMHLLFDLSLIHLHLLPHQEEDFAARETTAKEVVNPANEYTTHGFVIKVVT